jgi:hypothetical protein
MADRQLRSRSVLLKVGQDLQTEDPALENLSTDSEIGGNKQTDVQEEIQITGDVSKSVCEQHANPVRASDSIVMPQGQLRGMLAHIMKHFQEETC